MLQCEDTIRYGLTWAAAVACSLVLLTTPASAQLGPPLGASTPSAAKGKEEAAKPPALPAPEGANALPAPDRVWIDVKNHEVLVDGYVALRQGYLEMLACPAGTKEHESVVAVETRASTVHAALLAVGAREGHPVQFRPEFAPAKGTEIEVEVRWLDEAGKWKSARAQEWIREVESKKEMANGWVFGGSGFWTDKAGKRIYQADGGEFICVSNFTSAMLDVPFKSSDSNAALQFEAFTERIPNLGTRVRLVLKPVLEKDKAKEAAAK